MKGLLCLALALLLCIPMLAACAPQTNAVLALTENGLSEYCIVYAKNQSEAMTVALRLADALQVLTGAILPVVADSTEEVRCEILVGNTEREASKSVTDRFAAPKNAYLVAAVQQKLVLRSNGNTLHLAADLLISATELHLGGSLQNGTLTLPADLCYSATPNALPDNAQLLAATAAPYLQYKSSVQWAGSNGCTIQRGLCTDGTAIFTALISESGGARIGRVPTNGDTPTYSQHLSLGNAASLCYNTLSDTIAVCHGDKNITLLHAKTLTVLQVYTLDKPIAAITYMPESNRYLARCAEENTCLWLDCLLRTVDTLPLPAALASHTPGDISADSRYLYFSLAQPGRVLVLDTVSTRYFEVALPTELQGTSVTSICASGTELLIGTTQTAGGRAMRVTFAADRTAALYDRFTKAFTSAGVNSTGISATKLFDTYTVAGKPSPNTVMQGGCTNGRYAYICMENQASNYTNTYLHDTRIVRVDLLGSDPVKVSAPLKLHHSNDMCYNSKLDRLVVVHNGKEANTVSFVHPETLEVTGIAVLPYSIYSIAYEPISDQYVVGLSTNQNGSSGRDYAVLDGNFKVICSYIYTGPYTYYSATAPTTQGIDCDERYIYSVLCAKNSETGAWTNWLVVHDWSGAYQFSKILPGTTAECENVFHIGSTLYVGYNGSNDPVYKFEISTGQ